MVQCQCNPLYKEIVEEEAYRPFPEEPKEQLELAIRAVFVVERAGGGLPQGVRHPRCLLLHYLSSSAPPSFRSTRKCSLW
jgi:hypothetical protein